MRGATAGHSIQEHRSTSLLTCWAISMPDSYPNRSARVVRSSYQFSVSLLRVCRGHFLKNLYITTCHVLRPAILHYEFSTPLAHNGAFFWILHQMPHGLR